MIYSVWNTATRAYDYFEAPTSSSATHAGAPPKSLVASSLGATPEQAAWSLPVSAKKVGSGELPRGRIASRGGELAGIPTTWILIGIGAILWWRSR